MNVEFNFNNDNFIFPGNRTELNRTTTTTATTINKTTQHPHFLPWMARHGLAK